MPTSRADPLIKYPTSKICLAVDLLKITIYVTSPSNSQLSRTFMNHNSCWLENIHGPHASLSRRNEYKYAVDCHMDPVCRRCRHAVAAVGPYVFAYGGLRGSILLDDFLLADDGFGSTKLDICDPRAPAWSAYSAYYPASLFCPLSDPSQNFIHRHYKILEGGSKIYIIPA